MLKTLNQQYKDRLEKSFPGHAGVPGQRGGSAPRGSEGGSKEDKGSQEKNHFKEIVSRYGNVFTVYSTDSEGIDYNTAVGAKTAKEAKSVVMENGIGDKVKSVGTFSLEDWKISDLSSEGFKELKENGFYTYDSGT